MLAAGLVLAAALVGLALRWRERPASAVATAAAPMLPSQPMASAASAASPSTSAASLPALGGAASAPLTASEARRARMRADWCGYGADEHLRESDELMARIEAAQGTIGPDALAALNATDGARVLEQAAAEVQARWVAALRRQGDPRSRALAEYLLAGRDGPAQAPAARSATEAAEAPAAARARLQALARSSTDPMITALALQRPCAVGACENVEPAQWSRLEPQNLQAWLTLLGTRAKAREDELAYVMERMATQGAYSNSYERDAQRLLMALPQAASPGLQGEAELHFLTSLAASWPLARLSPVSLACRRQPPAADTLARCEAIAQRLWQRDDLIGRLQALQMSRALLEARPAERAVWEPRAREAEAVQAWMQLDQERLMQPPEGQAVIAACTVQARWREVLQERVKLGEWAAARQRMQAAGADEAALAAAWQQQAGRKLLDPVSAPSATPAPSAAAPGR